MGCTASVLDQTQPQGWVRAAKLSETKTEAAASNPSLPEQSSQPSKEFVKNDNLVNACTDEEEELLVDDELFDYISKCGESERAMYEGSCDDGYSRADLSMVESTASGLIYIPNKSVATEDAQYENGSCDDGYSKAELSMIESSVTSRVDPSKSVATEDALYEDSSSEIDNHINGCDVLHVSPISNGDSDKQEIIRDDMATISDGNGDILFCPTSEEASFRQHLEKFRNQNEKSTPDDHLRSSIIQKRSSMSAYGGPQPGSIQLSKWQSETFRTKTSDSFGLDHSKHIDISIWEQEKKPTIQKNEDIIVLPNVVKKPRPSKVRAKPRTNAAANDRDKLKNEIARLQQQIEKLASKSNATKSLEYVTPTKLIVPIENSKKDEIFVGNNVGCVDGTMIGIDPNIIDECQPIYNHNTDKNNLPSVNQSIIPNNSHHNNLDLSLQDDKRQLGSDDKIEQSNIEKVTRESIPDRILPLYNYSSPSIDSNMMQFSVSTTGTLTNHGDPSCDESTQLFGSELVSIAPDETSTLLPALLDTCQGLDAPMNESDDLTIDFFCAEETAEDSRANKYMQSTLNQEAQNNPITSDCVSLLQYSDDDDEGKNIRNNIDVKRNEISCTNTVSVTVNKEEATLTATATTETPIMSVNVVSPLPCDTKSVVSSSQPENTPSAIDTFDFVLLLNLDPWNKESKLDEENIISLIEKFPKLCCQKYSFEGFHGSIYPLSAMCALGASVATIKKCYQAYPDAITKADAWVGTSLHYACSYHSSFDVVEYVTKKNPPALKAVNQFNRLPLHMACMFDAEPIVISYLIRKYPGGCKKIDKYGMLPLHIACDSDLGIESTNIMMIQHLIESYPDACMQLCEVGTTPLVISISRKASLAVIKVIVGACVESLSIPDHLNRIPLHTAVATKASNEIIQFLIISYPSGLIMEDNNKETPYDYAIRMGLDHEILNLLELPDRMSTATA